MQKTPMIAGFLAVSLLAAAPAPKLIGDIDLNKLVQSAPLPPGDLVTLSFSFSPDEKWIAVTYHAHPAPTERKIAAGAYVDRVLLVPLNGSADQLVKIDPKMHLAAEDIRWSPNSDAVLVQEAGSGPLVGIPKLYDIQGNEKARWEGPANPVADKVIGFLDPQHLVSEAFKAKSADLVAAKVTDLQGHVVDQWPIPKHGGVVDVNPDRRLIATLTDEAGRTEVLEYPSKKPIQTESNPQPKITNPNGGGAFQRFAEQGKTLCSIGGVDRNPSPTECWDIDTGKKIAEFTRFLEVAAAGASTRASRLVLTQVLPFQGKVDGEVSYGQRVVWDYRSNSEVAAWDLNLPIGRYEFAPVAISATGRFVVEGAKGILRLYQIP